MFYKIFVNTKLKIKQPFVYSSKKNLNIGDVVLVPFGKNELIGIVVDKIQSNEIYSFKIKEIIENINSQYIKLSIVELKIIKYLITNYNSLINKSISLYLTKKISTKSTLKNNYKSKLKIDLNHKQSQAFNEFFNNSKNNINKFILYGVTGSGKTEIYIKIIEEYLQKDKQVLILLPDITLTSQIYSRLENHFDKNIISIIHSKITKKDKTIQNNLINKGQKKIIIGARSAIFSRFHNLGLIIIDEFHDTSYKQDQDPRYDTIKLAEYISDINNIPLILGSATPRIDIYYQYLNIENHKIIKLDEKFFHKENSIIKLDLVDLKKEKEDGNSSIFSKTLKNEIKNSIERDKKIILYVNRRGFSPILLCNNCGYIDKCPRCDIPLNIHKSNNTEYTYMLCCHHCDYMKNINGLICNNCQNRNVKFYGFGTQYIKEEIEKIFSLKSKNIFILDKDYKINNLDYSYADEIYKILNNKNIKVIIGTQLIVKGWDLKDVNLIGILSADLDFSFPDYKGYEDSYQKLSQLIGRVGRVGSSGSVILQTYDLNNKIIDLLKNNNYMDLYNYEIINREKFKYPPFCEIIKITVKSKQEKSLIKRSLDIYNLIKKESIDGIQIYLPINAFPYKKKYFYRRNIILKVFNNNKKIKRYLRENFIKENNLIIDIEPSNLL